ncbi:MAG: hypothetical protein AB8G14_08235 [Ilumatobacter sp.]
MAIELPLQAPIVENLTNPEGHDAEVHRLPGAELAPNGYEGVLGTSVSVETFDEQIPPPRHPEVEAVWFALNADGFETTAVVAVPPLSGDVARAFAFDLARTGAALVKRDVHVVSTVGLAPDDTVQAMLELPALAPDPVFVVTDAPAVNTAGLPVLQSADRVLLVVGMGHSDVGEAEHLVAHIGTERIVGSAVIAPPATGRRRRGRNTN